MHSKMAGLTVALLLSSGVARADVSISGKPTQNMSCVSGVCTATAQKAVLNAGDLQTILANGDVAVKTGGGATNIVVKDALSWASTSRLTLDADQSVEIDKPVTLAGSGALTISYDDQSGENDLYFFSKGQVTFANVNSSLVINGQTFTLKADLPSLAAAMTANQNGSFALANDYDAKQDFFKHSPVETFQGSFEGLGHTISHLKLRGGSYQTAGLFGMTEGGTVRDIYLKQIVVHSRNRTYVGGWWG